jgi:hypothetical protein
MLDSHPLRISWAVDMVNRGLGEEYFVSAGNHVYCEKLSVFRFSVLLLVCRADIESVLTVGLG